MIYKGKFFSIHALKLSQRNNLLYIPNRFWYVSYIIFELVTKYVHKQIHLLVLVITYPESNKVISLLDTIIVSNMVDDSAITSLY